MHWLIGGPGQTSEQVLTVMNATKVHVNYHWGLFTTSSINNYNINVREEEKHHFVIKALPPKSPDKETNN